MSEFRQFPVVTADGVPATLFTTSRFLDDSQTRLIRMEDGREYLVPREMLRPEADGSYTLTMSAAELERSLGNRQQPEVIESKSPIETSTVIPAIEEDLQVTKRQVETGNVRIRKTVERSDSVIDEPLIEEGYDVERIPVNRVLSGPVEPRYEGDVMILPVVEEVLVVEKRLILREEIRVTRTRKEKREPQQHTVRREHVEVERA